MNITSTNYSKSPLQLRIFQMLFLLAFTFAFYSCSATAQDNSQKDSDSTEASIDQGEKTFTFHRMSNGKDNQWDSIPQRYLEPQYVH